MKKVKLYLCLTVCICVFYGCKKGGISTEKFCSERKIENDTVNFVTNICLELLVKGDTAVINKINSTLVKSILCVDYDQIKPDKAIEEHIAAALEAYHLTVKELPDESLSYPHSEDIDGVVTFLGKDYLCYKADCSLYAGGAHAINTITNFVFDLKTGKRLTQGDIFTENYKDALNLQFIEILRDTLNYPDNDTYDFGAFMPNWNFAVPEGNFIFIPDTLVYIFNPYEIAPYSSGKIEVKIPYQKIKDIMTVDLSKLE
ncbi:MAG: RsiV family protein [Prevotellaceae bacterium]|jgi:hypothetical protein|nr:RsiV family protein [Prevotellaceae bacterium]